MNPLTNVKNINKLNDIEAELGTAGGKTSWHQQYKDSAYVFIGGLPYDLTEGDIICVFSQYGEIVNINLVRDKKSGKSKGYCFLAYEDQRSTILAVDNFNGIKLLGRVLRVDHVSDYRKPKEDENDDEVTQKLRQEGCAPSLPVLEDGDSEDDQIPTKKVKKEHKQKSRSHDKKKKKKKHKKHSSKSRVDSSDSESSQSEEEESPVKLVQVKQEVDRGYEGNKKRERKEFELDEFTHQRGRDRDRSQHRGYDQQDQSRSREEHREHEKYRDKSRERSGHRDMQSHREQERSPLPGKSFRNFDRSSDSSRNRHRDNDYKDRSDRGSYKDWHREQEDIRIPDRSEGRGRSRDYYSKR